MVSIKQYLVINAGLEKVYNAITEQEGLARWWTEDVVAKPEIGSTAEFIFGEHYHNKMKITNLIENKRVEWECFEGDLEWIGTKFIFDLQNKDGKTVLRFSHTDWKEATDFYANCNFHWGFYLNSLKSFCETGKGTNFQERFK